MNVRICILFQLGFLQEEELRSRLRSWRVNAASIIWAQVIGRLSPCCQQLIFRVMAFRRVVCGFGLQIPGCWMTRHLHSCKSAAARLMQLFLGGIAFKTLSYWRSLLKGPILERNGGSAIGPTSLSAPDVKKILTAYDMTMSWMQLLL